MTTPPEPRMEFAKLPGGGYAYTLLDTPLRIEFRYLRRKDSQLHAEVDVQCAWAGVPTQHTGGSLSCADHNLSNQNARRSLAIYCAERARTKPAEFDWSAVIDAAALAVIRAERRGDDMIVLDDAPAVTVRDYDIDGLLLPADASTFLVARGDSLKSLVTLYVLGTLAHRDIPTLFLDWEWTPERHKQRKERLFGVSRLDTLHYLKCKAPLTFEVDRIRRQCEAEGIEYIGVDSVGMAADGKLVDDDTARRFHQALAWLPPSLCAAHIAKSAIDADVKTDPHAFGSIYFENLCRMAWAVKRQPNPASDDETTVAFFPTKQNDGRRASAVGWQFTFKDQGIEVKRTDLTAVEGLAERLPLWQRMVASLKDGPQAPIVLATELNTKVDTVDRTARRHPKVFTRVVSTTDGIHRLALVARVA